MREPTEVLAGYARLAAALAHMLALARSGEWAHLPHLEGQCSSLFQELRDLEAVEVPATERSRLAALDRRIRADQAELERIVRPQFLQLMRRVHDLETSPAPIVPDSSAP
jgi:hypothetical protein